MLSEFHSECTILELEIYVFTKLYIFIMGDWALDTQLDSDA